MSKILDSKNKDQVDYSISRVFINNPNGTNLSHEILHLEDNGHLLSQNGLEYEFDKEEKKKLIYKRTNQRNYFL